MVCVKLQIIKKDTFNIVHINASGRANFGCQLIEITVNALFPIFQLFKLFSVDFNRWYIASDSWIYCHKLKAIFIANAPMHCIECIFSKRRRRRRNWTKMIGKMDLCGDEWISTEPHRKSNPTMETDGIVMPASQPTHENRSIKLYEIVICVSFLFFNLIFRSNSNAWKQKSNKVQKLRYGHFIMLLYLV